MVDPIILQSISILISSFGIIVAFIYYAQVLRNTRKASQRELILQRSNQSMDYARAYMEVRSMTNWESGEDWYAKYGPATNPEASANWLHIMRLYDLAGLYLREGADPDLLFALYTYGSVISLWERFEPVFLYQREVRNDPLRWEPFEYLYNEAKKRYREITLGTR